MRAIRLVFSLLVFSMQFTAPIGAVEAQAQQAAPVLMLPADIGKLPMPPADHTLSYGQDANQVGELRLPAGPGPHPIIVLVHGGCWMPGAGRYLAAMGEELKKDGIASWSIEYRRIGQPGGGWPGTYLDVGHAIDHLREAVRSMLRD